MNKSLVIVIIIVGILVAIIAIVAALLINHDINCNNRRTSYFNAKDGTSNSTVSAFPDIFADQCFGGGTLAPNPN